MKLQRQTHEVTLFVVQMSSWLGTCIEWRKDPISTSVKCTLLGSYMALLW